MQPLVSSENSLNVSPWSSGREAKVCLDDAEAGAVLGGYYTTLSTCPSLTAMAAATRQARTE